MAQFGSIAPSMNVEDRRGESPVPYLLQRAAPPSFISHGYGSGRPQWDGTGIPGQPWDFLSQKALTPAPGDAGLAVDAGLVDIASLVRALNKRPPSAPEHSIIQQREHTPMQQFNSEMDLLNADVRAPGWAPAFGSLVPFGRGY